MVHVQFKLRQHDLVELMTVNAAFFIATLKRSDY